MFLFLRAQTMASVMTLMWSAKQRADRAGCLPIIVCGMLWCMWISAAFKGPLQPQTVVDSSRCSLAQTDEQIRELADE
jgi:hypothetical protein